MRLSLGSEIHILWPLEACRASITLDKCLSTVEIYRHFGGKQPGELCARGCLNGAGIEGTKRRNHSKRNANVGYQVKKF